MSLLFIWRVVDDDSHEMFHFNPIQSTSLTRTLDYPCMFAAVCLQRSDCLRQNNQPENLVPGTSDEITTDMYVKHDTNRKTTSAETL